MNVRVAIPTDRPRAIVRRWYLSTRPTRETICRVTKLIADSTPSPTKSASRVILSARSLQSPFARQALATVDTQEVDLRIRVLASMAAQFDFREYVQTPARTYLCPGWLTSSRWFDLDELSDITVKFDDREVQCHKILLARRCHWFCRAFHNASWRALRRLLR